MTEQPGYVLDEAVKLFETLRRRMNGAAPGGAAGSMGDAAGDVWSQAVHEAADHLATGAPECRYCPICRTVSAARESGPDIVAHVVEAGQSLMAAAREAMAAYERSRPPQRPGQDGSEGASGSADGG